jgi:hypothetical protein
VTAELTLVGRRMWNISGTEESANPCYPFASKERHMDSLPTGSTQSWFIVAAVAFSPVIVLFLADAIGWLIRQARGKGGVTTVSQDASGVRQ